MIAALLIAAVSFRAPEIVPPVQSQTFRADVEVRFGSNQTLTVACDDAKASGWVGEHLRLWYGTPPRVASAAGPSADWPLGDEGYRLSAKPEGVSIEAKTLQGVRYALFTLRQVVERDSSGYTVSGYRLPACEIEDSPALAFRGLHLCWFPELSADYIERQIRLAALYKFNHVVLESWGVYRSARHPWFGWKEGPMTREAIARLVAVARDLGVTLIPQINVFGHASAARSCTGKHAVLEFHPERQALFEPAGRTGSGWNWCLSNPEAVRTVRELVVEMHEAFGSPPFFHIGCDEADEPSCASCRAVPYAKLVSDHIAGIADLLKARGARAMMWHDMLLKRGDPRWKGFYANGSDETARLPSMLPKDVIICDWYYGNDPGGGKDEKDRTSITDAYPTLAYFAKDCGFDTLTCPWEERNGIRAQTKYAREHGLYGVLETVWHHFGGARFPAMVQVAACGAWGHGERTGNGHFSAAWRWGCWDMGSPDYKESGWYDNQVSRDIFGR